MCITKHPSLHSEGLSLKLTKKDETDNLINKLWNEPFTYCREYTTGVFCTVSTEFATKYQKLHNILCVFKKPVPLFFIRLQLYKTLSCDL